MNTIWERYNFGLTIRLPRQPIFHCKEVSLSIDFIFPHTNSLRGSHPFIFIRHLNLKSTATPQNRMRHLRVYVCLPWCCSGGSSMVTPDPRRSLLEELLHVPRQPAPPAPYACEQCLLAGKHELEATRGRILHLKQRPPLRTSHHAKDGTGGLKRGLRAQVYPLKRVQRAVWFPYCSLTGQGATLWAGKLEDHFSAGCAACTSIWFLEGKHWEGCWRNASTVVKSSPQVG